MVDSSRVGVVFVGVQFEMRAQIDQRVELLIALRTLVGCLVGRVYPLVDVALLECSHFGLTVAALEVQLGRMNGLVHQQCASRQKAALALVTLEHSTRVSCCFMLLQSCR